MFKLITISSFVLIYLTRLLAQKLIVVLVLLIMFNVLILFALCCLTLQLLAPDPSLKRFKSPKKGVLALKRIGDVLTVVVVAGTLLCFCLKVLDNMVF